MRFQVFVRHCLWLLLLPAATGQDLVEVLGNRSELSNLTTYLSTLPDFSLQLSQQHNITFLAPDDSAFATFLNSSVGAAIAGGADESLIQAIFTYHVLNGTWRLGKGFIHSALQPPQYTNVTGGQYVNAYGSGSETIQSGLLSDSTITSGPVEFTGGYVYVIDRFLTIPQNFSSSAIGSNLTASVGAATRVDILDALDLVSDVTIFVPSNEAFQSVGNLVGNWTSEDLTNILTYHVVNGTVTNSDDYRNSKQTTLNGEDLTITVLDNDIFVDSARVIQSNILIANGVMHVIDNVLNPNNRTARPLDGTSQVAFEGAGTSEDNPFTSGVPTPTGTFSAPTASTSAPSEPSGYGGLSSGALAGAIVGGILGGLLIIGAIVFLWRRKKKQAKALGGTVEKNKPDGYSKAELPGEGVHRYNGPKQELWTNANRHEADGTSIQRTTTGEAAELPGEDVDVVRSRATQSSDLRESSTS